MVLFAQQVVWDSGKNLACRGVKYLEEYHYRSWLVRDRAKLSMGVGGLQQVVWIQG